MHRHHSCKKHRPKYVEPQVGTYEVVNKHTLDINSLSRVAEFHIKMDGHDIDGCNFT